MAVRRVLVVNAGSSSVKLRVLDGEEVTAGEDLPAPDDDGTQERLSAFLSEAGTVDAVGHRLVHGGPHLRAAVVVDDGVRAQLEEVRRLAPLHVPAALRALDLVSAAVDAPAVACFDTAFHATLPPAASAYAVPRDWAEELGIRRYGFHGLSHDWASRRGAAVLGAAVEDVRLVTCHLGSGSSLAAVDRGRSVDTTMGFTPAEGLVMATRSGSVDPGALVAVLRARGLSADELEDALEHHSGLLGLSGVSGSARQVEDAADRGDRRAALALAVWAHRVRAGIAAMAAAMGGLDGVVFTGGIGEHSPRLRADACAGLAFLGIAVDPARNAAEEPADRVLSPADGTVGVAVVAAREDLVIARQVRAALE